MIKLGLDFCTQFLLCFWSPMLGESANVASLGAMPTAQPSNTGIRKQWHEDITQDLRNHLVHKLCVVNIKAICGVTCCPRGVLEAEGLQKEAWLAKLEGQEVNFVGMHETGKWKPKRWSCICWFGGYCFGGFSFHAQTIYKSSSPLDLHHLLPLEEVAVAVVCQWIYLLLCVQTTGVDAGLGTF